MNVEKSCYITFALSCDIIPINTDVAIFNRTNDLILTLNRVESTKYLGIRIDQYFRWNKHIIDLLKRTRFVMFLFHKLKYILSTNQFRVMYNASFHSIISHGILGWGGAKFIFLALKNPLVKLKVYFFKFVGPPSWKIGKYVGLKN